MPSHPYWFDTHPLKATLIKRFKRNATFIIGKDDPLVQPVFELIDCMVKPKAMQVALDRVNTTIEDVFVNTDYRSVLTYGLTMGKKWLNHDITMTTMRPIILHIHGLTKTCIDPIQIRHLHAIGQALSTLHCQDHLKGWYLYSFAAWFYQDPFGFEPLSWIEEQTVHLYSVLSTNRHHYESIPSIDFTK